MKNEFIIPELPTGRLVELKIYSNWGDKYFIGLNGIEIFDASGNAVTIEKVSCNIPMYKDSLGNHLSTQN